MMKKLEGKIAVITGGTEGLGWLRQNFSSKRVLRVFFTKPDAAITAGQSSRQ
jgi:hypothetical protein